MKKREVDAREKGRARKNFAAGGEVERRMRDPVRLAPQTPSGGGVPADHDRLKIRAMMRIQAGLERRRAAYQAAQGRQKEILLQQAAAWRQAQDLRGLIAAVEASATALIPDDPWRAWAQAQADALDPVLCGAAPFALLPPFEAWDPEGVA